MSTFLAQRIRAVHANPAEKLDDLLIIAVQVMRMEVALDNIVGDASEEDARRELAAERVGQ
jgi:hypothetical protein